MSQQTNEFGQVVGAATTAKSVERPPHVQVSGRYVTLIPITEASAKTHAADLAAEYAKDNGAMWTFVFWEPATTEEHVLKMCEGILAKPDWQGYFAVLPETGKPVGLLNYLRINPALATVEVGGIAFGPSLRRTRASTEAHYLLARDAMALGYRRYEWKCDSYNIPSYSAALRLGFIHEGVFRQAAFYKGRNRDSWWGAFIESEWDGYLKPALEAWLDPGNFDAEGRQRTGLRDFQAQFKNGGAEGN